jgi:hypothetical protein
MADILKIDWLLSWSFALSCSCRILKLCSPGTMLSFKWFTIAFAALVAATPVHIPGSDCGKYNIFLTLVQCII